MNRTDWVKKWWAKCVEERAQLESLERNESCRPMSADAKWKKRITTETLWREFASWAGGADIRNVSGKVSLIMVGGEMNKTGFMTIFYGVSGATPSMMRHDGKRVKVAKFENWSKHLEMLEAERC